MTDTVEISRDDWDKLVRYHNEQKKLLVDVYSELSSGLQNEKTLDEVAFLVGSLGERAKSFSRVEAPFGITPLKGGD
jgi:hypothetical protein